MLAADLARLLLFTYLSNTFINTDVFTKGACRQWARAGADAIVLAARSQDRIIEVARTLEIIAPATKWRAIATDVSREEDVDRLFKDAIEAFGRIDVVVHAAGVLGPVTNLGDAPVEDWWRAFVSCNLPVGIIDWH